MRGYGQFCPVAVAGEIFAERWTPLILRELFSGAHRFNDIRRGVPLISRSLLTLRLRELEDGGVIASRPLAGARGREYSLTRAGEEFREVVNGLGAWGQRWAIGQFDPQNLDVSVLMWNVRRGIDLDRLPAGRTVVRFDLRGVAAHCRAMRTWWVVLQRPEVDLCLKDPGFEVSLVSRPTPARWPESGWDRRPSPRPCGRGACAWRDRGRWRRPSPAGSGSATMPTSRGRRAPADTDVRQDRR